MSEPTHPQARLAFEISGELSERAEAIIAEVRSPDPDPDWTERLAEVVIDLTREGLHFYFLHPLELAGAGLGVRSVAKLGVASAEKGLPMVVRRAMASMSEEQLREVVDFLDRFLIR